MYNNNFLFTYKDVDVLQMESQLTSIEAFSLPPDYNESSLQNMNGHAKTNGYTGSKVKLKSGKENGQFDKSLLGDKTIVEDLRNYSYEGEGSSPGSLSSCKYSFMNLIIFIISNLFSFLSMYLLFFNTLIVIIYISPVIFFI